MKYPVRWFGVLLSGALGLCPLVVRADVLHLDVPDRLDARELARFVAEADGASGAAADAGDGNTDAGSTSSATAGSMDFDLFGDTPAKADVAPDPEFVRQVEQRRSMLQTHQILGLSTLGLMATSVVLGQLNYGDLYAHGGAHTGDFLVAHRVSTYASTGAFLGTAFFSLFAPTPIPKDGEGFDTTMAHKIGVIGASAGMVTQVALGFLTARAADAGNPDGLRRMAQIHQAVGYATVGFMAAAASVWVF